MTLNQIEETAPPGVARLFPRAEIGDCLEPERLDGSVAHLLAAGDHRDLRWLIEHVGEDLIRDGLERWGSRRLDRRNRLFWSWLLDSAADIPSIDENSLVWPLD